MTVIFYDNNDHPVKIGDKVYPGGKFYQDGEVKDYKFLACEVVIHEGKAQLLDQRGKHHRIDCVDSMRCTDESNWQDKRGHVFRPFYAGYFILSNQ